MASEFRTSPLTTKKMIKPAQLLWFLLLGIQGATGEDVVTHISKSLTAFKGEKIYLYCKLHLDTDPCVQRLHEIGSAPRSITCNEKGPSEASTQFTANGSGSESKLKITDAQIEDEPSYFCHLCLRPPEIFGIGTQILIKQDSTVEAARRPRSEKLGTEGLLPRKEVRRRQGSKRRRETGEAAALSVSIFSPSQEQIKEGSLTVVCKTNTYYPGDAEVIWKADGKVITKGVENSQNIPDMHNPYSRTSKLTLTKEDMNRYIFSCEVKPNALSPLITTINRKKVSKKQKRQQCK